MILKELLDYSDERLKHQTVCIVYHVSGTGIDDDIDDNNNKNLYEGETQWILDT